MHHTCPPFPGPSTPPRPLLHRLALCTGLALLHFVLMGLPSCQPSDNDGDGYTTPQDCDDADAQTYPGAVEVCDGKDNNCNNRIDEGLAQTWYPDQDGDGIGAPDGSISQCAEPAGYVLTTGDCDDHDATSYPGGTEVCDTRDNDCDGLVDEGVTTPFYPDADADGYGTTTGAIDGCKLPPGYVWQAGDCDDHAADAHPGALELCDARDNDCDGKPEAENVDRAYLDQDGDGFGRDDFSICQQATGYAPARGDCDDTKAAFHPGATDAKGDAVDQDCGGSDGPQPHVGLSASSQASIQAAIDASFDGDIVWVGPGTWLEHDLTFRGKAITLIATRSPAATVIDAGGQGRVFVFNTGEDADSILDGFTLTGGKVTGQGAGVMIDTSSPTLTGCFIMGNRADAYADATTAYGGNGGGLYLLASSATLSGCTIAGNSANEKVYQDGSITVRSGGFGGGMYLNQSTPTLTACTLASNLAVGTSCAGGGVYATGSAPVIDGSTFTYNTATGSTNFGGGGGLYLTGGSATITASTFSGNRADLGAAMYLYGSSPTITGTAVIGNQATGIASRYYGGGLYLSQSSPTMTACVVAGNRADFGGGLYLNASSPALTNCTLTGNSASGGGGGLYLFGPSSLPQLRNDIVAFNAGYNIYGVSNGNPTITWSDLYNPIGPNTNLAVLDSTNLSIDPKFMRFSNDGDAANDDLHLAPGSPLIDAGDPAIVDADGSDSDLGADGGPAADGSYRRDIDHDGLYDGWEQLHGLSTAFDDAAEDADGDGLTNLEELSTRTNPRSSDTDGDKSPDLSEVQSATDPNDWFDRPGGPVVTAKVPEDFASIQAALNAVQWEGAIDVGPATYAETLRIEGKTVTLTSRRGPKLTIVQGNVGSVVTAVQATVNLSGFTLTGGNSSMGGGLYLSWTGGTLSNLTVSGNTAVATGYGGGGAAYLFASSPTITGCSFTSNNANYGGGIELSFSSPALSSCTFTNNDAWLGGGGMHTSYSSPTLTDCNFNGNRSLFGGGLALSDESNPVLTGCRLTANTASNPASYASGGGLMVSGGNPQLTNCTISANNTTGLRAYGGGVRVSGGNPTFTNCVISGNTAIGTTDTGRGGGMYVWLSNARLDHCTLYNNSASGVGGSPTGDGLGGGLALVSSSATVSHVTVYSNFVAGSVTFGGGVYLSGSSPSIQYTSVTGNIGSEYAGVYLTGSKPQITGSIFAHNAGYNLFVDPADPALPTVTASDLYSGTGVNNHNLAALDPTTLTVAPQFLAYGSNGAPIDFHLALTSPLIDLGPAGATDDDGGPADMGSYGGPGGGGQDLDDDGYPDWFWPGDLADAPAGIDAALYDCDDEDATVHTCP